MNWSFGARLEALSRTAICPSSLFPIFGSNRKIAPHRRTLIIIGGDMVGHVECYQFNQTSLSDQTNSILFQLLIPFWLLLQAVRPVSFGYKSKREAIYRLLMVIRESRKWFRPHFQSSKHSHCTEKIIWIKTFFRLNNIFLIAFLGDSSDILTAVFYVDFHNYYSDIRRIWNYVSSESGWRCGMEKKWTGVNMIPVGWALRYYTPGPI